MKPYLVTMQSMLKEKNGFWWHTHTRHGNH